MKKLAIAIAVSAFTMTGLIALSMTTAQAGGYSNSCWAGYQYRTLYPCWAAEAFEPNN